MVIVLRMQPIVGHLALQRPSNPFRHLCATVSRRDYLRAYACTMLLVTGGFMLMPFGSAYIVNNMQIPLDSLPVIYMVTGLVSIVGRAAHRQAQRLGRQVRRVLRRLGGGGRARRRLHQPRTLAALARSPPSTCSS